MILICRAQTGIFSWSGLLLSLIVIVVNLNAISCLPEESVKKISSTKPSDRDQGALPDIETIFEVESEAQNGSSEIFIPKQAHLQMSLPFAPYDKLRTVLASRKNLILKNRGEAHITVLTPPEYNAGLDKYLTIKEINEISRDIQTSEIEIDCIGTGSSEAQGVIQSTYYVVVNSDDLKNIRRKIQLEFVARGGDVTLFPLDNFFPHVTLGFTDKDLHAHQGVIKNKESCLKDGKILVLQ